MSGLEQALRAKVKEIAADRGKMDRVKEWIANGYYGKVINFRSLDTDESYHLVFTRDNVAQKAGDYPSSEFSYQGKEETLVNVLSKKADASSSVKAGKLEVRGSLNEAVKFEKLL